MIALAKRGLGIAASLVGVFVATIGQANAAILFSQDFESGLGANESTAGLFVRTNLGIGGNGSFGMGHARSYSNGEYSYYQISNLLVTGSQISLTFNYWGVFETHFDRFNVLVSTGAISPPTGLLNPTAASDMQFINLGDVHHPNLGQFAYDTTSASGGQSGIARFDLSGFAGQSVNIRFQFGTDGSITANGFKMDDVVISSAVPEPCTLALLGLGLAGLAATRRRK